MNIFGAAVDLPSRNGEYVRDDDRSWLEFGLQFAPEIFHDWAETILMKREIAALPPEHVNDRRTTATTSAS